ncbi:MAG: esterase, partial [Rhodoferax sp.]|nr:esterase [Rhodoferax sp.]
QSQWHAPDEHFYFQESYIAELQSMADEGTHAPGPELALISQRDEVLDWREMQARYPQARRILLPEGDHAISDFASHVDGVLEFLGLV